MGYREREKERLIERTRRKEGDKNKLTKQVGDVRESKNKNG